MRICPGKNLICTLRLLLLVAVVILSPGTNRAQTPVKSQPRQSFTAKDVASDDDNIIRSNSASSVSKPRLSAIVVGISDYDTAYTSRLQFARRDAEQFVRLLRCAKNVQVDTVITLFDQEATMTNLGEALIYLSDNFSDTSSRKPDYVVFYFSGHGQIDNRGPKKEGYFIMYNTEYKHFKDLGCSHTDLIEYVEAWMRYSKKVVVVADACHSGRFAGTEEGGLPAIESLKPAYANTDGRLFELLSGTGVGKSYEDVYLQHGIFTYYLIRGALGYAADENGVLKDAELGNYVKREVIKAEKRQFPRFNNSEGFFIQFNPCMDYSGTQIVENDTSHKVREAKSGRELLPIEILFDSLLTIGNICFPANNSAYSVLQIAAKEKEYASTYKKMRFRYISAVLNSDIEIMSRYLNQDVTPWLTKFADIGCEIEMHKTLMELFLPTELKYRKTAARFFFFQAMAWYEYAKLVPESERVTCLRKGERLIARSLKIRPDSPAANFLQSQIYLALNPGGNAKDRPVQLAEIRSMEPEWRIPYLYARDRASMQEFNRLSEEHRTRSASPEEQPVLPGILTAESPQAITPDQIAAAFSGNPLLAEDLYFGYALQSKSPEKLLKKHRKMAISAYNLSLKVSGILSSDKTFTISELDILAAVNDNADKLVAEETRYVEQLDANTEVSEETKARWAELDRYWAFIADSTGTAMKNEQSESVFLSKDYFTDPVAGKFILARGGTFNMGCSVEQGSDCSDNEKPAHLVTLSDYYIGETEVTQAQWKAVMGSDPSDLVFKGCNECPVEGVSWDEVQVFISKLNRLSRVNIYRLPTEAEWEYAARGGNLSKGYKHSGSDNLAEAGWYDENAGGKTHPVKGKKANELGIYDLSGNVYEWCSDIYGKYHLGNQINPVRSNDGFYRVLRGGSWNNCGSYCRVSYRYYDQPDYRDATLGFRLAASPR